MLESAQSNRESCGQILVFVLAGNPLFSSVGIDELSLERSRTHHINMEDSFFFLVVNFFESIFVKLNRGIIFFS